MNDRVTIYAVPEAIASELNLTRIRVHDGKGFYLLSASDLRPYGIARALGEGAVVCMMGFMECRGCLLP